MILAYITSAYGRASDTFIREEVAQLRRMGHEVHTFSINRPKLDQVVDEGVRREQAGTLYILEIGLIRILSSTAAEMLRKPKRFVRALRLAHRFGQPGIKGRLWQLAYLLEACYVARELRSRGVQHIHDHIGEGSATVAILAATLVSISYSITFHGPSVFYAPERFCVGQKVSGSAFVACITEFARSQCMIFTSPEYWHKLRVIRCGVDESFLAVPLTPVPEALRIACVGRLCSEKGQMRLLEAIAQLRSQGYTCELLLVGDGPTRSEIEAAIAQLGLEGFVRIMGWQSSKQITQHLLDSRALVLPSFAEGLPIVIMEAFALGRPVISTYVGGIPELVEHAANGWLVPAGSIEHLASALREALDSSVEQLSKMGEHGRKQVLERHNSAVQAQKLARLFRKVIDDS